MKPGYKTTEFWVTVIVALGTIIASLDGVLPKQWALVAAAISTSAYSIARGLSKYNQ